MRLATEELWTQLCGAAPPAAVTRSLGQSRARLAEHYRLGREEQDRRKQELLAIRGELAEQHGKLLSHKREFEAWAQRRQAEIDQEAERLVNREQQWEEERSQSLDAARQWRLREIEYQQEIRRLRSAAEIEAAGHDPQGP
jgi:hypothetical protein